MSTKNQEKEVYNQNILSALIGLLIGSLAGAVTMLLMAPQSGQATRSQLQEKGIELRDQASDMMEDAMAQVRLDRKKITVEGRQKTKELFEQGKALVAEQLENVSEAATAGKKAILSS